MNYHVDVEQLLAAVPRSVYSAAAFHATTAHVRPRCTLRLRIMQPLGVSVTLSGILRSYIKLSNADFRKNLSSYVSRFGIEKRTVFSYRVYILNLTLYIINTNTRYIVICLPIKHTDLRL